MTRRSLIVLTTILAVLAAAAFFAVRGASRPSERRRLWTGTPADAGKIVLSREGGPRVELVRRGRSWRMTAPYDYPAASSGPDSLLEKLSKAVLEGPLTAVPDRHGRFGVDPGQAIRLEVAAKVTLELLAGKTSGDNDAVFVRLGASPEVFEAKGLSRYDLERSTGDWLDKTVLKLPPASVTTVVIKSTTTVALERGPGGSWKLRGEGVAVSSAPGSSLSRLLEALNPLEADQVAPGAAGPSGAAAFEVRVGWTEGTLPRETVLKGWKEKDGFVPLVREDQAGTLFLASRWKLEALNVSRSDLRQAGP